MGVRVISGMNFQRVGPTHVFKKGTTPFKDNLEHVCGGLLGPVGVNSSNTLEEKQCFFFM